MLRIVARVRRVVAESGAILFICLVAAAMLGTLGARAESSQNERCQHALKSFNGGDWAAEKMPRADQCSDDIRLYLDYLGAIRDIGSDGNTRAQPERLLAAAEAGNRSAQILYTLLFTEIVNSKYMSEIVRNSFYSRYASYISAWGVLTKSPYLARDEAESALADGVVEASLLLHFVNYLEWRHESWPGDRRAAAAHLLAVAEFYANRERVRPYLRRLLSAQR